MMKFKLFLIAMITMVTTSNAVQAQNSSKSSKALIAYFSWSGNTRALANQIKDLTGGELFEITTVKPYSANYNQCVEEAKVEKANNARPSIKGQVENMDAYDVIFIGYPNWWGTMPMAIFTFLDSYDFQGKTIVPFCTHGGGGVQRCFKDFSAYTTKYDTREGFLVNGASVSSAKPHVEKWLNSNVFGTK